MTAQGLVAIASVLLSVLFTYVPGMNEWYAGMQKTHKQLLMGGLLVLTTGFIMLSSCMEWWTWVECDKQGVLDMLATLALAIAANQGTHQITPEPQAVRTAKSRG